MINPTLLQRIGCIAVFFLISLFAIGQNSKTVVITGEMQDVNAEGNIVEKRVTEVSEAIVNKYLKQ